MNGHKELQHEALSDATDGFSGLRSHTSTKRLQQIASLRARGIGEHINLPQLVVCGDQSAGKSSVLEGITGIPFPRQDGLCTRFATEIVLVHSDEPMQITAEIIPHVSRGESLTSELRNFVRKLSSFEELPEVISDATDLMGVHKPGSEIQGPSFAQDILKISVCGQTGLHLSVVDLPGLISVPNEEQTAEDVDMVHALVDSYVSNPRTIILAVVQASNDIANQSIIQKSRKYDPSGQRTVGIITKPDLINKGTEGRIARLARNEDTTKLKLGFFLLKNPAPTDLLVKSTFQQRLDSERAFFSAAPWKDMDLNFNKVGIISLRSFLQQLLDRHVAKELPLMKKEIAAMIEGVQKRLDDLGEERPTTSHLRTFLSRLAMRFHNLTSSALYGNYDINDRSFFARDAGSDEHIRVRAFLHLVNTQYANDMRQYGHTLRVEQTDPASEDSDAGADDDPNPYYSNVTESEMKAFVLAKYRHTRGRELPGNTNHVLLTELFHHQSQGWRAISKQHVDHVAASLEKFVKDAIMYITSDDKVRANLLIRTDMALMAGKGAAYEELEKLCADKDGPLITYNHYYTDNVQNARHTTTRNLIKKALDETSVTEFNSKMHISNNVVDAEKLLLALQKRVLVDMEDQACSEARQGLLAYYKVARKTFVDNLCIQVIERHLVRGLAEILSPEQVAGYSDEELFEIAGEDDDVRERRRQLNTLQSSLLASLEDYRN